MSQDVASQEPADSTAAGRVRFGLQRFEAFLTTRSVLVLGVLAGMIAIVKSGVVVGTGTIHIWSLDSWPYPAHVYPPLTYGFRAIAKLVGTESAVGYNLIALVVFLLVLFALPLIITRAIPGDAARWAVIVLMSGPAIWILAGGFGRTDTLVILGAVLLGTFGKRLPWAAVATVIAILGNPEQTVVFSLGLLIVSAAPAFRPWARGALLSLIVSTVAWVGLTAWSHSLGVESRADWLSQLWRQSLQWFFIQAPLELYAAFGLSAAVLAWAILDQRRWSMLAVISGGLLLPLALTASTLDQTRVLVACSMAVTAAAFSVYAPTVYALLGTRTRFPLAITAIVALTLPAIEITANVIRVPWAFYYPYFQAYVLDQLPLG